MEAGNSNTKIRLCDVNFFYGKQQVLYDVNAAFDAHALTAIVGPSGQGKSTLLTAINRLWEEIPGARAEGRVDIHFKGGYRDIAAADYPAERLRRRVGMVFQEPNPLPMSIYKNVAFPLKLSKAHSKTAAPSEEVRTALEQAFLWDEVKHRLNDDARKLSGGQQQRLCIARALILSPEILLLDEPTASLDAKAAGVIESLLVSLKPRCTLVMVSHYMEQVERIADRVLEMSHGRLRVPGYHDRG
jgi:phosphate transport system ATP-binding protein